MENNNCELSYQSLEFLFKMERWKNERYLREFDVNGKTKDKLTDRQYQILYFVDEGRCSTLSELEEATLLSGSSLSITISKMVKEGLLQKKSPKIGDDRRKNYIVLTEKGEKMLQESTERVVEMFDAYFLKMNSVQKQEFHQCLEKLDVFF